MTYDVVGVGFGPSNIGLAIAMEEASYRGSVMFLEREGSASWHNDMLLDGADIQNNPLRDLITPVNPRSYYTFVNYLHESGRFFSYLNLGQVFPLRKEFVRYLRWVARHFTNVRYNTNVAEARICIHDGRAVWLISTTDGFTVLARTLVLGTGRRPNIPKIPGLSLSTKVVHLTKYLSAVEALDRNAVVGVLGSSQSAVEIILDLLKKGFTQIYGIHRSFAYRLKDTSPFSDEVYFPEFVSYYHALKPAARRQLDDQVRATNYSSADRDVINALYRQIYEDALDGLRRVIIYRNCEIRSVDVSTRIRLDMCEVFTGDESTTEIDTLILATGFLDIGRNGRDGIPSIIKNVEEDLCWTKDDDLVVERDYKVAYRNTLMNRPRLYLNGLCESSHGLGDAGSLSLVSLRSKDILQSITRLV